MLSFSDALHSSTSITNKIQFDFCSALGTFPFNHNHFSPNIMMTHSHFTFTELKVIHVHTVPQSDKGKETVLLSIGGKCNKKLGLIN